jgi:hypothetical protein
MAKTRRVKPPLSSPGLAAEMPRKGILIVKKLDLLGDG